jgi:hypothetical protein
VPEFPPARGSSGRSPSGARLGSFHHLRPSPLVRCPNGRASGPSARLASLHRAATSRVATPAMALLRFPLRPACARTRASGPSSTWPRGRPPRRIDLASLFAASCRRFRAAARRRPFQSFPPRSGWVPVSRSLPSWSPLRPGVPTPRRAPLQGFVPRSERGVVVERPPANSPRVPPSRVFSSTALAPACDPGAILLCASCVATRRSRHPALWSVASRRSRHRRFRPPTLLGFVTLRSPRLSDHRLHNCLLSLYLLRSPEVSLG